MNDYTLLKLTGESVDIMCKMNPKYEEYFITESGRMVLYVQVLKALYGCVVCPLLWIDYFWGNLKEMGFKINTHDSCIQKKIIDHKQCTIAWYVYGMKISQVNQDLVTRIIQDIEMKFGKISVTLGHEHKFLRMDINFKNDCTVTVQKKDYLQESIFESGLDITHESATPAKGNLFDLDGEAPSLEGEECFN